MNTDIGLVKFSGNDIGITPLIRHILLLLNSAQIENLIADYSSSLIILADCC